MEDSASRSVLPRRSDPTRRQGCARGVGGDDDGICDSCNMISHRRFGTGGPAGRNFDEEEEEESSWFGGESA